MFKLFLATTGKDDWRKPYQYKYKQIFDGPLIRSTVAYLYYWGVRNPASRGIQQQQKG